MTELIYWDHYYDKILLLNLLIIIALFTGLRLFSGAIAHVNASYELLTKDNPAFGISLSGTIFAVAVMLSGTIYSMPGQGVMDSVVSVGLYGVIGIILMALARLIFDKITLPALSLRDEIVKGNKAVAIADAANVLAAALIIRAAMMWVPVNTLQSVIAVLAAFAISQLILTASTIIRMKIFGFINKEHNIQQELKAGNMALALRFAGKKTGTAFAISIAADLIAYEAGDMALILSAWAVVSVIAILALKLIYVIAEKLILFNIDTDREVLLQRNVAIGALQAVIFVSLGMLLAAF